MNRDSLSSGSDEKGTLSDSDTNGSQQTDKTKNFAAGAADALGKVQEPLTVKEEDDMAPVFTSEEKRAWLDQMQDVCLGSDAFFPFGDNIERAHKSGVEYIAQAGGSVRDDHVIDTCDKYGITMAFTGVRLFHH